MAEPSILKNARQEFDALKEALTQNGVEVIVHEEPEGADAPDSLYPNNWFVHIPNGPIFLLPMFAANRRREVQPEWLRPYLQGQPMIDLRDLADRNLFLEGTGSLILDHDRKTGYACLSPRTNPEAIHEFEKRSGYSIFAFDATDSSGVCYYHTNVMMALGEQTAIVCVDGMTSPVKSELLRRLADSGRTVLLVSQGQVSQFAGNMIQLKSRKGGDRLWVCSKQAHDSLTAEQRTALERDANLVAVPLPTIEWVGGGSARCMIAELF